MAKLNEVKIVTFDGEPTCYFRELETDITRGTLHVIVSGDRLDLLAYRYYGDCEQFYRITEANLEIVDPLKELPAGEQIIIPGGR